MAAMENQENTLSGVVIALMKGVVYQDTNPKLWQQLLNLQIWMLTIGKILKD